MIKTLMVMLSVAAFTVFTLSGCGVKGQLQRPADAPKDTAVGPDGKKPHKPNVLDALL